MSRWSRLDLLRNHWHQVAYALLFSLTIVVYVLHFLSPAIGKHLEPFLSTTNLLMIILVFVAVIAARLSQDSEHLSMRLNEVKTGLLTRDELTAALNSQVAALANGRFYPTKDETFRRLAAMTMRSQQVLMATRFSPGDITLDAEYWKAVREKAFDHRVLSIRVHSLAHLTVKPVDVLCKVIEQFRGADQFTLGVAFFNNDFEMIVSDDEDCIFCFHDFEMTIRNGVHFDSSLATSRAIVANFGETFRRMLDRCYLVVEFERFVRTEEDVRKLQAFVRHVHREYCKGVRTVLERPRDMDGFLRDNVFG